MDDIRKYTDPSLSPILFTIPTADLSRRSTLFNRFIHRNSCCMKHTSASSLHSISLTRLPSFCFRGTPGHQTHIPAVCAQRLLPQPVTYKSIVNTAYSIRFWRRWFRKDAKVATFWTVSGDNSSPSLILSHLVMILYEFRSTHARSMNPFVFP